MNEANQTEWQAPPLPEEIKKSDELPRMSEAATLGNIFFSPGETFEDLRRKPRFLLAGLIMILAFSAFNFLFTNKIGFEQIVRSRLDSSAQIQQLPADQKQKIIEQQTGTFFKTIGYVAPSVVLIVIFLLGGLIYWLGANAMGGTMTYIRGVSVWVYSSFPPTLVSMLANILVLFLKSADDIDIAASQSGLVQANPSFFIDAKTMPVLGAVLGTFDLFFIWGWILAAIGLSVTGKISKSAAWAVVLMVALLNVAFRVVGALFS
ncbi:MAG TPA: Yip1 family protein [Pyrinomonadaceae bacterium]|nr:Yip1 family protein [Pyrinomonadaceae bacterium]